MEVYKGVTIYNAPGPIVFGSPPHKEFKINQKFESRAWPSGKIVAKRSSLINLYSPVFKISNKNITSAKSTGKLRSVTDSTACDNYTSGSVTQRKRPMTTSQNEGVGDGNFADRLDTIMNITDEFGLKGRTLKTDKRCGKQLLQQRIIDHSKLERNAMALSAHFHSKTLEYVRYHSDYAFGGRRKCENINRQITYVENDISNLNVQKNHLTNIIREEMEKMKEVKKDFYAACSERRAIHKSNISYVDKMKLLRAKTISADARLKKAAIEDNSILLNLQKDFEQKDKILNRV